MSLCNRIMSQKYNATTIVLHSRDGALTVMCCVRFLVSTEGEKLINHSKWYSIAHAFGQIPNKICCAPPQKNISSCHNSANIYKLWFLFMSYELSFMNTIEDSYACRVAVGLLVAFFTKMILCALQYNQLLVKLTFLLLVVFFFKNAVCLECSINFVV